MSNKIKKNITAAVASILEFPMGAVSSEACVDIIGDREVRIFPCRTVLKLSSELVEVGCSSGRVSVRGADLIVSDYIASGICVSGKIFGVDISGGK
ncbi:MAG: hypothetical protein IJ457_04755 [Clostridia bacterium]|nr:hypothetical protein [Clostridia bacterium]